MKRLWMMSILAVTLLACFALPARALAAPLFGDKVVFGDNYNLTAGETLDGSLVVFGGNARLEAGSTVTQDVLVFGGNVNASGDIRGSVVVLGGSISLDATAIVGKDVVTIGGSLQQAPGALVTGEVINGLRGPLRIDIPGAMNLPRMDMTFDPFFGSIWFMLRAFLWAAVAVLMVLFLPEHTQRIAQAAASQPLVAGGLGLLTVVAAPVALLILVVTILGIPVALLAFLLLAIAWSLGLTALGLEVGERLERAAKQQWSPVVSAGLGTFLLILVINGARAALPCVGWLLPAAAGMLGLGAVILTRFGTQSYPLFAAAMEPRPVSPLTPPLPPEPHAADQEPGDQSPE